jgi:hypothetical protein
MKRESIRMQLEYEKQKAEEKLREQRRQQEEFRRHQEAEEASRKVYETPFNFSSGSLNFEELLKNLLEATEAFAGFTFTSPPTSSSSSGTSYTFRAEAPPRQEYKPTPPRPEEPKAWTRDSMMRRLCELAKVEYPSELEERKLYLRAARHCHPDQIGGSHELMIELSELKRLLRI